MDQARETIIYERIFERFGVRFLRAENGEAESELLLGEADFNAMGLPFGGILFNMADCTAGAAQRSLGSFGMTVSSEARFLRGARNAKRLFCRAKARKEGKTLGFVDASVEDETGAELAAFSFLFVNYREKS